MFTYVTGDGHSAARLARTVVCLRHAPWYRFRLGVVLLYGQEEYVVAGGTLFGILDTPLMYRENHGLLKEICTILTLLHRYGRAWHAEDTGATRESGRDTLAGWSIHARTCDGLPCALTLDARRNQDTALGLEVLVAPSSPTDSMRAATRALSLPPFAAVAARAHADVPRVELTGHS